MSINENEGVLPDPTPETEAVQYVLPAEESAPAGEPRPFASGVLPDASRQAFHHSKGFLGKLFDTGFHDYITPEIVKVVFVLAIVVGALMWLTTIIGSFVTAASGWGFNVWPIILSILFGWIPPLLYLIAVRLGLEAIIALIRLSKEARRIRHLLERQR